MNHRDFMNNNARSPNGPASQRGVSLLFALMALAAMLLAAVALVRSVDSGAIVLGNLGFKQEATQAADRAAEAARAWLLNPVDAGGAVVDLNADGPNGTGYYATSQDNLDPTGRVTTAANKLAVIDWGDSDSCACLNTAPATCASCSRRPKTCSTAACGDKVASLYVITRLCPLVGAADTANSCAKPPPAAVDAASCKGEIEPDGRCPDPPVAAAPYYRIIVRTVGARGAVSFTETIVH